MKLAPLFFLLLISLLCSCSEDQEDYLSENFIDRWQPVEFQFIDCSEITIPCGTCSACYNVCLEVEVFSNSTLEIHETINFKTEILKYDYAYDSDSKSITINDSSETYSSLEWSPGGLLMEGFIDGCKSLHRMERL